MARNIQFAQQTQTANDTHGTLRVVGDIYARHLTRRW